MFREYTKHFLLYFACFRLNESITEIRTRYFRISRFAWLQMMIIFSVTSRGLLSCVSKLENKWEKRREKKNTAWRKVKSVIRIAPGRTPSWLRGLVGTLILDARGLSLL